MIEVSRVSDFEGKQIGMTFTPQEPYIVDKDVNTLDKIIINNPPLRYIPGKSNVDLPNLNYTKKLEKDLETYLDKIKSLENDLLSLKMDNERLESELSEIINIPQVDRASSLLRIEKLKNIKLEKEKKALQCAINCMYEKLEVKL